MSYAIISLGGKQYRVSEGEKLLVDRLRAEEGTTFAPRVLFSGGDGNGRLAPEDVTVTARVVGHVLGKKIRIGKYKAKKGYRRHTGYRSRLSQIEIESIAAGGQKPRGAADKAAAKSGRPEDAPKGMPSGYEEMTVADVSEGSKTWNRPMLEAALEYERAHDARKTAIAALESALARKEES
jgi:large subunit ribosomal protein L21